MSNEIPGEISRREVEEAAKRVGLELPIEDLPTAILVEDLPVGGMYESKSAMGGAVIVIPVGDSLSERRAALRHELAHYMLHRKGGLGRHRIPRSEARRELEAIRLEEGGLTSRAIADVMLRLIEDRGLSEPEAGIVVSREARQLGIPKRVTTMAKRFLREHLVGKK